MSVDKKPTVSLPAFGASGTKGFKPNLNGKESVIAELGSLSLGPAESTERYIVGVDYGTTFTASDLSEIVVISNWPGSTRDVDTAYKTPSRIAYAAENARISKDRWGYQVEPGMIGYAWTKLLLDEGSPITQYDDSSLEKASQTGIMHLPEGKAAVDVVTNYLAEVYQHILKTIAKRITEETLRITPLEFWFTAPAIWSDRAQSATRTAAQRAGFGSSILRPHDKIFLISEPEAAAIATLRKYGSGGVGGSVKTTSPLRFEELCTGIGGKCGSTAVDRNFYKLMSERFGEAFNKLPSKRKSPGSQFMNKFEGIKRDFGNSDEQTTFELPLNMTLADPDPKYFDDDELLVIISSDDLREIFDPVVGKIVQLIKKQIEDANKEAHNNVINRILLVGGFGDSEYLRKAIKSAFEGDSKIAITVPEIPQAAIVQGAAVRGLEGLQSTTKRCRRHYGFSIHGVFRPGIDDDANSYWDSYTDTKMVQGLMKWAIDKGQKYAGGYAESFPLHWKAYPSSTALPSIKFYACDQTAAPERCDSQGVYEVGDILISFANVDKNRFDSKLINGSRVYDIRLQLKVTFGAQEGVLKFEATSQGQRIGETTINFSPVTYY
ncbi:actin-like ATPase domain-containing protein [Aspergillus varians]